jgi:CO/xanthine dehydrogenase Mo-binding subunit
MTATLTTAEVAEALETTPRELRKFLRSNEGPGKVGKGARYALPGSKREIDKMRKQFAIWAEARKAAESDTPDASDDE